MKFYTSVAAWVHDLVRFRPWFYPCVHHAKLCDLFQRKPKMSRSRSKGKVKIKVVKMPKSFFGRNSTAYGPIYNFLAH